jgi:hypothetical protein
VIPRTAAMTAVENELRSALVTYVGGARLTTSSDQVADYLLQHHDVTIADARIHCY